MAVPLRGTMRGRVPPPAAPPGLTRGMARIATDQGGRRDIRPVRRVGRVPRYPVQPGVLGAARGIQPTPRVPGAGVSADQRTRLLAFLKASRGQVGLRPQMLQALQGGGRPPGPLYQGHLAELIRSLLAGA